MSIDVQPAPTLTFAALLYYLRKRMHITQREFAKKINVTVRAVQYLEFGFCQPSKRTIKKMLVAYPKWEHIIRYYEQRSISAKTKQRSTQN